MQHSPTWQAKNYSVDNKKSTAFMEPECHISGFRREVDEKTPFFWVITQRVAVISYRHFGRKHRSHLK